MGVSTVPPKAFLGSRGPGEANEPLSLGRGLGSKEGDPLLGGLQGGQET